MPFTVFTVDNHEYKLPNSMRFLNEHHSMKYRGSPILSQVKIFGMLIDGEEYTFPYKIFIGVMRTNRESNIIIFGEYYLNNPYDYGSFHHIEVFDSERIDSDRESFDILNLENNTYAILLKTEVIIIGITPTFQKYLDENEDDDDGDYDNRYLYVKRFDFVSDITNSPFDTPIIDCRDRRIDKKMTSRVEKHDDNNSTIRLSFCCVCSCYDDDCRTKSHWSTENYLMIYISNEEIKIDDRRYITINDICVVDGEYNDFPTIRNFETNDSRYHEITYELSFPEDESEEEDD